MKIGGTPVSCSCFEGNTNFGFLRLSVLRDRQTAEGQTDKLRPVMRFLRTAARYSIKMIGKSLAFAGVDRRRSWAPRWTTWKTGRSRTDVIVIVGGGGSSGSACSLRLCFIFVLLQWSIITQPPILSGGIWLRFILVLLERSHDRLHHVTHHLEARVDDEVYKTYNHQ